MRSRTLGERLQFGSWESVRSRSICPSQPPTLGLFVEGRAGSCGLAARHGRGEAKREEALQAVVRSDRIGDHESQRA